MNVSQVTKFEKVLVYRYDRNNNTCKLDDIAEVFDVLKSQCKIRGYHGRPFSLKTGETKMEAGVAYYFKRATAEELERAKVQLAEQRAKEEAEEEARAEAQERAEEEKRKAAYEALPEPVKLARKAHWFFENEREDVIAKVLSLDTLRAVVREIEAAGKDTE